MSASPLSPPEADAARLKESLQAALADLGDVFSGLVQTAEQMAFVRCPYLNIQRECTAQFACPNQLFRPQRERALCTGQHKINFSCGTPVVRPKR